MHRVSSGENVRNLQEKIVKILCGVSWQPYRKLAAYAIRGLRNWPAQRARVWRESLLADEEKDHEAIEEKAGHSTVRLA